MQPNDPIVGGIILRRVAIRSPNYVPFTTGWTINQDGTAEFAGLTVSGGSISIVDNLGNVLVSITPFSALFFIPTLVGNQVGADYVVGSNISLNIPSSAGTVAAAGFVNWPAPSSMSLVKRFDATNIHVRVNVVTSSNAVNTVAQIGVLVNGVDNIVTDLTMNAANVQEQGTGDLVITGLNAGTYTIQLRWQRTAGAGTVSAAARISMFAEEVSP